MTQTREALVLRAVNGEPARHYHEVVAVFAGSACLTWPYNRNSAGYGMIWVDGRGALVSRLACESVHGPAPTDRHQAAHSCGNGHLGCVNPHHLEWKTQAANFADKVDHGTDNRGARHPMARLTEDAVRQIRALKGALSEKKIAERFGVSASMIGLILRGKKWGWLA